MISCLEKWTFFILVPFPRPISRVLKVFRYDGSGPVVKKDIDVLHDAVWRPSSQNVYPDRPASPGRRGPTAADAAAGRCSMEKGGIHIGTPPGLEIATWGYREILCVF